MILYIKGDYTIEANDLVIKFGYEKFGSGFNGMKKKGKQKIVFAKDYKQAAIAVLVMFLFVANSCYMVVKHFIDESTSASNAQQAAQKIKEAGGDINKKTGGHSAVPTPPGEAQDANNIYNQTLDLQGKNNTAGGPNNPPNGGPGGQLGNVPAQSQMNAASQDDNIDIMSKTPIPKQKGKRVLISVANSGRSNPFLPAGENFVASSLPSLNLPAPPETAPTSSDAGKVMTTTISGILYDKYSPSAIINIEGADYLVKVGDIINHYKILSISKTQVIVKLGKNVYQAGVGELLSQTSLNQNNIANLNRKFGGNNNVSINVRKKG